MKLKMFLQDTLRVGSMPIPTRPVIEAYRERYNSLKKWAKFDHVVYNVIPGNRRLIHVSVPSETIKSEPFYYDVILELAGDSAANFSECDVKFFSNCPSFVFNGLAYVLAHWKPDEKAGKQFSPRSTKGDTMLVPGLNQKLGPAPTKDKPLVQNPLGIPMLDKSLYFAIFYIMETTTWQEVQAVHNTVPLMKVAAVISDFDHLMVERKRAENKDKEKLEENKKTVQKAMEKHERGIQRPKGVLGAMQPKTSRKPIAVKSTIRKPKQPKKV